MRARNIKPSFFKNEDLAECDPFARLLFVGLWCMATREGIVEYRPKKIKAEIFPYENGKCDVEKLLDQLQKFQFISILENEECKTRIILINKFVEHQNPHRNEKSCKINDLENYREITGNSKKLHSPLMKDERGKRNDERGNNGFNAIAFRPEWFPENDWKDVIEHKRKKKASLAKRALSTFVSEIEKATALGFTIPQCVDEITNRNWTGFKAEWMENDKSKNQQTPKANTVRQAQTLEDDMIAKALLEKRRRERANEDDCPGTVVPLQIEL